MRVNLRENCDMNDPTSNKAQPKNPLHGLTLEAIVRELETYYG
ncbi:MAG: DNA-binding protein, partial [Pseudomonadota bacterium]